MARNEEAKKGFLSRLLRNEAGNTLAMTAAATIPLLGMIGGGVDVSRLYLVKSRLQQACDAGALAGRKAQAGGNWTAAHQTTANNIFDTNYAGGDYGTSGLNRSFSESAGNVTGAASVTVPMMIMDMFGEDTKQIAVTCDAEMRLPHSDIMFVLDVTGSMGNPPASGGATSKLSGLRTAVQCFYEILMKIDTPAVCGSTPSGGISNDVQVRFGFVPYNVNANVGRLLPNDYLADSWNYQTRVANTIHQNPLEGLTKLLGESFNSQNPYVEWEQYTVNNIPNEAACNALAGTGYVTTGPESAPYNYTETTSGDGSSTQKEWKTDQPVTRTIAQKRSYNWSQDKCKMKRKVENGDLVRNYLQIDLLDAEIFSGWTYRQASHDVSGLKNGGSSWNASVDLPIGDLGTDRTVTWGGCIEERATVRTTNFNPIPTDALDLDIDLVPSAGDPDTLWGPALEGAVWARYTEECFWWGCNKTNYYPNMDTVSDLKQNNVSYFCPTPSRRLNRYETTAKKDDFVSYVNSLTANGNTYHDIGLLWGARLMSPTGIFAADNAFTPLGGEIERHMIFMTDGDPCTGINNYTAYGLPGWDRRRTNAANVPTDGCTTTGTITQQVNLRTDALCSAIKNMNITLWVVNYGGSIASGSTTATRLQNCASANRYYEATTVASLLTTFQQIASQISQLRLTQ